MSFRRRTFPEVLNNLLTSLTNAVAGEPHPYPPAGATSPPYAHNLLQAPVADIIAVYGSRFGSPHQFQKDADYALSSDGLALVWQDGGELPDAGTLIQVNYRPASSQPRLTDVHTGSVVRTLAESIALEIAGLYAQLEEVYKAGFLDTASGRALDHVVALLGLERVQGGKAVGDIEFTRSAASRGAINIPAGTRVMTVGGAIEYETTAAVTLAPGQLALRVTARDLEVNDPVGADTLTELPIPIAGIAGVTNPAPTTISAQDENDVELRTRAKNFLYGSERATLGALHNAMRKQGVAADVEEVAPGFVTITPHAENLTADVLQRLCTAIRDTRPAGVQVQLLGVQAPRKVNLELRISTASGLLEQDLRAAQQAARDKIAEYFARLPAKDPGSANRIVGLVLSVPEIEDVRILRATWTIPAAGGTATVEDVLDRDSGQLQISGYHTVLGELHVADPNLPTRLDVVVSYARIQTPPDVLTPPPDVEAIRSALTQAISDLNTLNASELPDDATAEERQARVLSYTKLYDLTPLPDKSAASPYQPTFTFTLASGFSRVLAAAADADYTLTPFERLTLGGVELHAEDGDDSA